MPDRPRQDHARLGREALAREDWTSAGRYFRKALEYDRDNIELLRKAAIALIQSNSMDEAIELAGRACKKQPTNPDNWLTLAMAHQKCDNEPEMHAALDRALRADPMHGAAINAKAKALHDAGDPDAAYAVSLAAYEQPGSHPLTAMMHSRVCRTLKHYPEAVDAARRHLDSPNLLPRHRIGLLFELGAVLDAVGDHDAAFEAFRLANGSMPPGAPLHADSVVAGWTRETLEAMPDSGNDSRRPVLVIGVARSGTTLTEQIIAAHPLGAGASELPTLPGMFRRTISANLDRPRLAAYASEYLGVLEDKVGPHAHRVADKHMYGEPALGMATKMFPNLTVVHCLRDPLDCCLSAYFQNFGANMPVSRDLTLLGRHYVAHRRIMDHWRAVLDIPIHTSVYEQLVAEPDARARALIAHCGLEWDDACLNFHESAGTVRTASSAQVRKPIYTTSRQRWRPYEKHLGPLIEALGPYAQHALPARAATDP